MVRFIFLIPLITVAFGFIGNKENHAALESTQTIHTDRDDTLKINDLVFADFFSPNGDGYNDTYVILNIQNYPESYLKVFNRWGEVVFESNNAEIGWNGSYGNNGQIEMCQDGVYTWKIEFKVTRWDERRQVVGHVNLIR